MKLSSFEISSIRKQVDAASVERVAKTIGVSRTTLLQAMASLDVHAGSAIQIRAALTGGELFLAVNTLRTEELV